MPLVISIYKHPHTAYIQYSPNPCLGGAAIEVLFYIEIHVLGDAVKIDVLWYSEKYACPNQHR